MEIGATNSKAQEKKMLHNSAAAAEREYRRVPHAPTLTRGAKDHEAWQAESDKLYKCRESSAKIQGRRERPIDSRDYGW